jgi:hypothetical protein
MKRKHLAVRLAIAAVLLAANARAEGLDGSLPLACDLSKAAQCDGDAVCSSVEFAAIDLPPVFHVDFEGGKLASEDGTRTSPIAARELLDATLVLQGHQNGRGWTMAIDRATGHLSATIADAEGAIVLGGACTAR